MQARPCCRLFFTRALVTLRHRRRRTALTSTPSCSTCRRGDFRRRVVRPLTPRQAKYVGTGHADLTRFEWAVNIHRDSYASFVGHHALVSYLALAENESVGRQKYTCLQKMLQPCGLPPQPKEDAA